MDKSPENGVVLRLELVDGYGVGIGIRVMGLGSAVGCRVLKKGMGGSADPFKGGRVLLVGMRLVGFQFGTVGIALFFV